VIAVTDQKVLMRIMVVLMVVQTIIAAYSVFVG
jgi:hypothetical protein